MAKTQRASQARGAKKARGGKRARGGKKGRATKGVAGPAQLRDKLVQHRDEILSMYESDLRMGQESSDDGTEDIVDRANNAYNREFMFSLSDSERQLLLQIEEALQRLDDGGYGTCVNCSQEIAKKRLHAIPWARYCIDCQERQEKGLLEEA